MKALNVGGGPKFKANGWDNLDSTLGFDFSPTCAFPLETSSMDLVYSSHTLEHLDDPTVMQVLKESHRVLKSSGILLIKIPDFDLIMEAYRRDDVGFFTRWPNIKAMTDTVASRGVKDTTAARAAQCLCGFWNKEFGHMFKGYNARHKGAYYGPPVMTEMELQATLAIKSPHAIAAALRAHVMENEKDYAFNHQNAWSRAEFIELLENQDYILTACDADVIRAAYWHVPGIDIYSDISAYYLARPEYD